MNLFRNIKRLIDQFVERGTDQVSDSMSESKRIRTLNRIILLSIVILSFYSGLMYFMTFYLSTVLCIVAILVYGMAYILVIKGKLIAARITFASTLMILISTFSIFFGKGLASEYWVVISGGFYLLIFKDRSTSLKMVLFTVFCFLLIEWAHINIDSYFIIDEKLRPVILMWNVFFIFISTFIISFVLRYSTEEFQNRIVERNKILSVKNKNLTDSINYAQRIQQAVLPSDQIKGSRDKNFFVVFKPKEIVSGDFYWIYRTHSVLLFAIVDGSVHGVSGAFTSITAHTLLTQCVEEHDLHQPIDIFNQFTKKIIERRSKWNDFLLDEIELTICSYQWTDMSFNYASNGNSIYLLKHINNIEDRDEMNSEGDDRYVLKKIMVPDANKRASIENAIPISGKHLLRKDDMLYLATDGMAQQLGGINGEEFTEKRLQSLMMSIQTVNVIKQELTIKDVLYNWKGKFAATDDITLLGFKV